MFGFNPSLYYSDCLCQFIRSECSAEQVVDKIAKSRHPNLNLPDFAHHIQELQDVFNEDRTILSPVRDIVQLKIDTNSPVTKDTLTPYCQERSPLVLLPADILRHLSYYLADILIFGPEKDIPRARALIQEVLAVRPQLAHADTLKACPKIKGIYFHDTSGWSLLEALNADYPPTFERTDLFSDINVFDTGQQTESEEYVKLVEEEEAAERKQAAEEARAPNIRKNALIRVYLAEFLLHGPKQNLTRATALLEYAIAVLPRLERAKKLLKEIRVQVARK